MLKQIKFFSKKFFLSIIIFVVLVGLGTSVLFISGRFENNQKKIAQAAVFSPPATGDNVSGFAWNSNIGWISFNSTGCDNNCAGPICISDGAGDCPLAGATYSDYGVKVNQATGDFSGYAWSSNVGWIYFGPDSPNLGIYGAVLASDAPNDPKQWAKYNSVSQEIAGWAKILSLGNDGWIKFNYSAGMGAPATFPIDFPFPEIPIGDSGATFPIDFPFPEIVVAGLGGDAGIDIATGDFSGWAWNGNDINADLIPDTGIGWISFNSKDCDSNGNGTIDNANCGAVGDPISAYKVTAMLNQSPAKPVTSFTLNDKCSNILSMHLAWTYSDPENDAQGAYYIQIQTPPGGDWLNPVPMYNPGWQNSNQNYFNFTAGQNIQPDTDYEFRVNVRDSRGAESGWSDAKPFSTPDHKYPEAYFIWTPQNPSAGEEVRFTAVDSANPSKYYVGLAKNDCDNVNCDYNWVFTYDSATVNRTGSTTTLIFPTKTTVHAVLNVIDKNALVAPPDDYKCSTSTSPYDIGLKSKLPKWIETK